MAPKWLFLAAKYGEEIFFPRKFCLHILKFVFRKLPHTLLISRSDCRKRCFQNLDLPSFPWLFIRFYLPVKACITTNISRIRFPLAKSCVYLYFNFSKCLFQFICSIESEHINMGSCGQYGNIGYYGPM